MYVGLAWHFWNTRWRRGAPKGLQAWERTVLLAPLALHGWLLYEDIFAHELRFGFAQALSVMMFLGIALYWIESLFYSLEGMQPLLLRSEEHTSELQSRLHLVCRLLLEKKK